MSDRSRYTERMGLAPHLQLVVGEGYEWESLHKQHFDWSHWTATIQLPTSKLPSAYFSSPFFRLYQPTRNESTRQWQLSIWNHRCDERDPAPVAVCLGDVLSGAQGFLKEEILLPRQKQKSRSEDEKMMCEVFGLVWFTVGYTHVMVNFHQKRLSLKAINLKLVGMDDGNGGKLQLVTTLVRWWFVVVSRCFGKDQIHQIHRNWSHTALVLSIA